MAMYATVEDVSNELNGLSITSSTTPSIDTVESWISQESDTLKRETGRAWGYEVVEDEYYDYDGSGHILLKNAPIISITSASYEQNGINAESESWVSLTEGRTSASNFIVYKSEADLVFHGTTKPAAGFQNFKTSYSFGYETTNKTALAIVAKKTALRLISTVINSQSSEEGGQITVDVISISDPSTFSLQRVQSLKQEIKELTNTLGTFKTYRYSRR